MSTWTQIRAVPKTVSRATGDLINKLGNAISWPFEALGIAIENGLYAVGKRTKPLPPFVWLGSVIRYSFVLVAAILKGPVGILAGLLAGIFNITGGLLTGQWRLMLNGFWDLVSSALGTFVVVVGKLIGLVQTIFYLQDFERPLTSEEKDYLRRVYDQSLNCYFIRISEGRSGIFGVSLRPFTMGNTIYMKSDFIPTDLMVHETMHSWQYQQMNNRYASDAIAAQWFVEDAYNWRKEIEERNKEDWRDFNLEGQAEFFQDIWKLGQLRDAEGTTLSGGNGAFFLANNVDSFGFFVDWSGGDFTTIARKALSIVRRG